MLPITVLITSCGGAAALNCIHALKEQKSFDIRIVAVDADPYSVGLYIVDKSYVVPPITKDEFVESILHICNTENVQVILPTFSAEIAVFACHLERFERLGVSMLVSPLKIIETFENKWNAFHFFRANDVLTPQTWIESKLPKDVKFPLFLKPVVGSGSRNSFYIKDGATLNFYKRKSNDAYIVQDYIQGREFTVDIVADRTSSIISAVARERLRVRNGLAVVARTIDVTSLLPYVRKIVSSAGLIGPMNIQGIINDKRYFFIDVNTRFAAGGLPLAIAAGVNIPLITLKLALGIPVDKHENYPVGLTMLRYYTEIFVDQENFKSGLVE